MTTTQPTYADLAQAVRMLEFWATRVGKPTWGLGIDDRTCPEVLRDLFAAKLRGMLAALGRPVTIDGITYALEGDSIERTVTTQEAEHAF